MGDADRGPAVSDQEILAVLANVDRRWLRPEEVADELPIPDDTLFDRFDDLHERGLIERDDDGAPGDRWRLAPGAEDEIAISDAEIETRVEAQSTKTTGVETSPREEETPETPAPDPQSDPVAPVHEPPADTIESFDPPGTPEEKDRRRDALRQVYAYLRKRGPASREDLEADVFPEAPGAHELPEDWWEETVRPGLATLPGVVFREEDGVWRFVEERGDPTED